MAEQEQHDDLWDASHPTPNPISEDTSAVGTLVPALGAGVVAAIAAGLVWGLVMKFSDYELGIVAWGVGLVVGGAVALAARGRRGVPLQAVAVLCALLGIAIGKYLGYAFIVQELAEEAGVALGLFGSEMREAFRADLGTVFGAFDLLWVGLAVFTAWRMLRPEEPEGVVAG